MRNTIMMTLAATSLLALAACNKPAATGNEAAGNENAMVSTAGDSITGTWKADLSTVQMTQKPDELLLKDGTFSCPTCTPPLTVAADGAFHAVTGHPYSDSISVKVDDDRNVTETDKKGGRVTGGDKYSVSSDGKMLTISFTDSSTPNAPPTTGTFTETRVGPAPAGAHAISGSWNPDKVSNINAEALTVTYRLDGDTLHMSSPSGTSYDARLDGTEAPIKGDIGGTTVSVKKAGDNGYQETATRDGKVTNVSTFTVGTDGRLHRSNQDPRNGSTFKFEADRQQ